MYTPTMPPRGSQSSNNLDTPYTLVRPASSNSNWSFRSPSSSSNDSTTFWQTPPKKWKNPFYAFKILPIISRITKAGFEWIKEISSLTRRRVFLAIGGLLVLSLLTCATRFQYSPYPAAYDISEYRPIRATLPATAPKRPDPMQWLRENSNNRHSIHGHSFGSFGMSGRPRAALISLVRNSQLEGMMQSMRQLELRWNHKYQYPWIFFNDEVFTEEFKAGTRNMTTAPCYYELVPQKHWSLPSWIDESRFMNSLEYLGTIGVGKGWMVSYHHMCRWNSGFFYKHPFLKDYDWYWRVEPDVHYFCDIDYDIFRFMRDNNMKYGFNMNILDDARSFPSLWTRTKAFATANTHLIHSQADLDWLLDPDAGNDYNNCQFFSNFEIGSLNFWRGAAHEAYFNYLDLSGGFYYERFGDAPVHTLSIAMFVPKSEIWWFRDIGYQHDINHHCPPHREWKCSCEPTGLDENFHKLVPEESPQRRPVDTCIRQFLGAEWLVKREGWTREGEMAFGGDGYHGYKLLGDE